MFARTHFKPTEVLSSDFCRALVSDDENNLAANRLADPAIQAREFFLCKWSRLLLMCRFAIMMQHCTQPVKSKHIALQSGSVRVCAYSCSSGRFHVQIQRE